MIYLARVNEARRELQACVAHAQACFDGTQEYSFDERQALVDAIKLEIAAADRYIAALRALSVARGW